MHESIHALDAAGEPFVGGLLPDMTKEQKEQFLTARQIYFNAFSTVDKDIKPYKSPQTITSTGLPAYAFYNEKEFLTVSLTIFYNQPEVINNYSPKLYEFYRDYFKLDPLNGYKDLE